MKSPQEPKRSQVPALDDILSVAFSVLDDGFVRAVDYMGSDESIVRAARVSYGKGTRRVHENRGLIRYLMRHRHTTPFEMCEIQFHVRVPMDTWRQWIRHRTASVNEYSTRYSIAIDAAQNTEPDQWRLQAKGNRQGSSGHLDREIGERLSKEEKALQDHSRSVYEDRLEAGVAREQARKDLPLSTYTEAYWKIDLHNLLHFLSLRMDDHAQVEIREYARVIGQEIVRRWCPITWAAFVEYRLLALTLFGSEVRIVQAINDGNPEEATNIAKQVGILSFGVKGPKPSRARSEFERKLRNLKLAIPWQTESEDA